MATPDPEIVFKLPTSTPEENIGDIHMECNDGEGRSEAFDRGDRLSTVNPRRSNRRVSDAYFSDFAEPVHPSNYHRMGVKPDPFNGGGDWDEYLSHFEDCAELGHWSDREKVLILAANLKGSARTFYIGLNADEKRSFCLLTRKLKERFGSSRHQTKWLSMFESRRRELDESIATLGDDLRRMALRAYPDLDGRAQEALSLNQFYKCLSVDMKCRCFDRNCVTISEAVDVVERFEALLGDSRKKPPVRINRAEATGVPEGNNDVAIPKDFQNILNRLAELEKGSKYRSQPFKQNNDRRRPFRQNMPPDRSCFICSAPDHFFRNCPVYSQCQGLMRDGPYQPPSTGNDNPSPQ